MKMLEQIDTFAETMIGEKGKFQQIKEDINNSVKKSEQIISQFAAQEEQLLSQNPTGASAEANDKMQEIFQKFAAQMKDKVRDCSNSISEASKGLTFIEKFDSQFTIAVFGKVKAGKSYLGNFVMGRCLKEFKIESNYDRLPPIKVHVYDRGKLSEQDKLQTIDESEELREFHVDRKEATSTIQWFNLGGLAWFDTPGIGSVTWENEMLAQEYVKNADLVLFVCNSDAAGTRQDLSELKQLYDNGKPVLLLLTQSDEFEDDFDDEGNEISVLVPKSKGDREDVENYMREALKEKGIEHLLPNGRENKLQMLTISVELAKTALEENNEKMFEDSNMGQLYQALIDITRNDAAEMKRQTPKKRVNEMINQNIKQLSDLNENLKQACNALDDAQKKLEEQGNYYLESAKAKITDGINGIIGWAKQEVENKDRTVSKDELVEKLQDLAANTLRQTLSEAKLSISLPDLEVLKHGDFSTIGDMKMRQESIPYEYTWVEKERRDPEGWEHIPAFFGKKYYKYESHTEPRYSTFETGANDADVAQQMMSAVQQLCQDEIKSFIDSVVKGVYEPTRELEQKTTALIEEAIKDLEATKF